jgi:hypothetical protein
VPVINGRSISGYTTSRNAVSMEYPLEESIESMLEFCDQVVVADSSDGSDNTQEILQKLKNKHSRLHVVLLDVPWDAPNHGIYDGRMKAFARKACVGDLCYQQDLDEIAEDGFRKKLAKFLTDIEEQQKRVSLFALPVIEPWGSKGKVRVDVNPWKWRISRNLKEITHGIPGHLRVRHNGLLYARPGTDGCDYIHSKTKEIIPCGTFMTLEVDALRHRAVSDSGALRDYSNWFGMVTEYLPTVYHFSWWSIEAKIRRYQQFWNDSWISLYNEKRPEGYNPFWSDRTLNDVSKEEIRAKAAELESGCGGWVFHRPWDGTATNAIQLVSEMPRRVTGWLDRHRS